VFALNRAVVATSLPFIFKCAQTVLTRGLAEATIRVRRLQWRSTHSSSYVPNSVPTPEKTQRIKDAAYVLVLAREELTEAQNRLDDYLNHRVVPIELKRND
jgi:hypothetical protein